MEDSKQFQNDVKLFYRGIGSKDAHIAAFLIDDEVCEEHGFDAYPNVVEGYPHDWAVLRILFHDFAQLLFK